MRNARRNLPAIHLPVSRRPGLHASSRRWIAPACRESATLGNTRPLRHPSRRGEADRGTDARRTDPRSPIHSRRRRQPAPRWSSCTVCIAFGIDEPRLVAFARAMSASGIRVLTPELAALVDYQIDSQLMDLHRILGSQPFGIGGSEGRRARHQFRRRVVSHRRCPPAVRALHQFRGLGRRA